jgi:cytochrome c oxidase cbb3-type subunit III
MSALNKMRVLLLCSLPLMAITSPAAGAQGEQGEQLYQMVCAQCHGVTGNGKGVNAAHMSVQPRSHVEREEMSQRSDQELFKVIEQGGKSINKSVLMPAWGDNLSKEQIDALVKHLRALCCSDA